MKSLRQNQSGFGFIAIIVVVAVLAFMGWVLLNRLGGADETPEESASEIIDSAQESVDAANQAAEKAQSLFDQQPE